MNEMASRLHESTILLVHKEEAPSDSEWDRYVDLLPKMEQAAGGDVSKCSLIVFTDGGSPNSSQRNKINEWQAGRPWRCAVVSSAAIVRGVATAFSWFNPQVRVFHPESWESAFQHALIPKSQYQTVKQMLQEMAQETGGIKTVNLAFAGKAGARAT